MSDRSVAHASRSSDSDYPSQSHAARTSSYDSVSRAASSSFDSLPGHTSLLRRASTYGLYCLSFHTSPKSAL